MIRLQQQQHALGSDVLLTLVGEDERVLAGTFEALWQDVTLFEQTFSRFLQDSELTLVNQQAGLPTSVSREFVMLAETAREYAERTDGLYNPFVLPALQKAGYKGSWPSPDTLGEAPDFSGREITDWRNLELTATTVTIPHGAALDFGGIGKGYLLDQLADAAERHGVMNYWFSLGGDILAAGTDANGKGWHIAIAAADDQGEPTTAFVTEGVGRRAVATSGTIKRRGVGWNHLIDPRTGRSTTSDVLTVSVSTEAGVSADVFAKCLLLVGSKEAPLLARLLAVRDFVLQTDATGQKTRILKEGAFV